MQLFVEFLRRTHLTSPSEIATLTAEAAAIVGWRDVALYLLDYQQEYLRPLPSVHAADREPLGLDATVGGRAFTTALLLTSDGGGPDRQRVWVPLVDGTDKIGVMELDVPAPDGQVSTDVVVLCERYAHLVASIIISKAAYGDVFEYVRRTRAMTVASELQWSLLPPRTFATHDVVIAAMLEPCYDNGGDTFDYAVNGPIAHLVVMDAMGHGLDAAAVSAVASAAYRQSRRSLADLRATYAAVHAAVDREFRGERFATGVFAELDCDTGVLRWVNAGHPPPLLLRRGHLVKTLDAEPALPVGVPFQDEPVNIGREALEPGDRVVVYTDGLPEARQPDGSFLGLRRLGEFIEREAAAGLPPPETLRRLRRHVVSHQQAILRDDATALMVEWRMDNASALVPQSVQAAPG